MNSRKKVSIFILLCSLPLYVYADNSGPQYDPTANAIRTSLVDSTGTAYTASGGLPVSPTGTSTVGTSTTIACDTTAVVVDDSSVANTTARKLVFCNPAANSIPVQLTGSGGTDGIEVNPGSCFIDNLLAASTPYYCHAASAVNAVATETK